MTLIYYFTRTGDSEKIAKDIAAQTGGKIHGISDNKSWKGVTGFIKGGIYAVAKKKTSASYEKPSADDTIYLCFPVWAGGFPPAVRSFIDEVGRDKIIAVPKSMSSPLNDQDGFAKVIPIIGKETSVNNL